MSVQEESKKMRKLSNLLPVACIVIIIFISACVRIADKVLPTIPVGYGDTGLTPSKGSIDIPIENGITFVWPVVANATSYEIWGREVVEGTSASEKENRANFSLWGTTGNTFLFKSGFNKDSIIEWYVIAKNQHGSAQSVVFTFSTKQTRKQTLTVISTPTNGGQVSNGGEYETGTQVTVFATPNENYLFREWNDEIGAQISTQRTYTFGMPDTHYVLLAKFEANQPVYELSAEASPVTGGIVSGASEYPANYTVSLDATPNDYYEFMHWIDESGTVVSTETAITFGMPAESIKRIACFRRVVDPDAFLLTVDATPINAGEVSGAGIYMADATVTLEATPNEDYEFLHWVDQSGSIQSTSTALEYTMPATDATMTAHFRRTYRLYTTLNPQTGGEVSEGGRYFEGELVTLEATPNEGYTFLNWTATGESTDCTATKFDYTMPATNATMTANFSPLFPLTVICNPQAGGSAGISGSYVAGQNITLNATPGENYSFVNWTDHEGTILSTELPFVYTMPSGSATVTANFAVKWFIKADLFVENENIPLLLADEYGITVYTATDVTLTSLDFSTLRPGVIAGITIPASAAVAGNQSESVFYTDSDAATLVLVAKNGNDTVGLPVYIPLSAAYPFATPPDKWELVGESIGLDYKKYDIQFTVMSESVASLVFETSKEATEIAVVSGQVKDTEFSVSYVDSVTIHAKYENGYSSEREYVLALP